MIGKWFYVWVWTPAAQWWRPLGWYNGYDMACAVVHGAFSDSDDIAIYSYTEERIVYNGKRKNCGLVNV